MMFLYLSRAPYLSTEGWLLYKIGITRDINSRKKSLSNSSVSGEFKMLGHKACHQARDMEAKVFNALHYYRYRTNREIFVFENDEEATEIVFETLDCLQEGRCLDPKIVTPDFLLDELEDRWSCDEYIV